MPDFVSKSAECLTQTFTHLVIAVTLFAMPSLCVKEQALKYHVKIYPLVWAARFLIKGKINRVEGLRNPRKTSSTVPSVQAGHWVP